MLGQAFTNPLGQFKPQLFMSFYTPSNAMPSLDLSSFNHGYNTSYAWFMAPKSGGVASTLNIVGNGTVTGSLLAVKIAEAALTGVGTLEAIGSLIVQAIAALVGSGTVSDAQVDAFLLAVASLSGTGGVTDANISALGEAVAALLGSGTAAGSTASGIAEAIAALTVTGTGLSTANVGQAVWSALAAANNTTGTMGEKLNDAGAAGNPWAALLAANNDPDTFGHLLQQYLDVEVSTRLAAAGVVNADIKYVNGVAVGGDGTDENPWNPA